MDLCSQDSMNNSQPSPLLRKSLAKSNKTTFLLYKGYHLLNGVCVCGLQTVYIVILNLYKT